MTVHNTASGACSSTGYVSICGDATCGFSGDHGVLQQVPRG